MSTLIYQDLSDLVMDFFKDSMMEPFYEIVAKIYKQDPRSGSADDGLDEDQLLIKIKNDVNKALEKMLKEFLDQFFKKNEMNEEKSTQRNHD